QEALDVYVDDLVHDLDVEVEEVAIRADAGIRDDDVNSAEALASGGGEFLQRCQVAHVARSGHRAVDSQVVSRARGEHEPRARLGQSTSHRCADAAAGSSDQGNSAFD